MKKKFVDHEDSGNFVDYSGQSEDQDEGDACGLLQLKEESVKILSDSTKFDKIEPSIVYQFSLPKPNVTLIQIRKMKKNI